MASIELVNINRTDGENRNNEDGTPADEDELNGAVILAFKGWLKEIERQEVKISGLCRDCGGKKRRAYYDASKRRWVVLEGGRVMSISFLLLAATDD